LQGEGPTVTDVVIAVPVLARPDAAQPLADSFTAATPPGIARMLFVCSPSDDAQQAACIGTGCQTLVLDREPGPGDFARKIQTAFDSSSEPFLFQAADDVEFTPGWLEAALARIEDGGYGVCGTDDRANPLVMRGQHSTHSLIRRAYVDECGASWDGPDSVFSLAYSHQWCDTELVELAKLRGCFTFAKGAVVVHKHPFYDRSVARDATYERGLAASATDRALFHQRQAEWLRELQVA
jgi:hypothetical protein